MQPRQMLSLMAIATIAACSKSPWYHGRFEGAYTGSFVVEEPPEPVYGPRSGIVDLMISGQAEAAVTLSGHSPVSMHVENEGDDFIDLHLPKERYYTGEFTWYTNEYYCHLERTLDPQGLPLLVGWMTVDAWYYPDFRYALKLRSVSDGTCELKLGSMRAGELDLVPIPFGEFDMGVESGWAKAMPQHLVSLSRPFWISRHEVTRGQYREVLDMPALSCADEDLPVEDATWQQAMDFCDVLTVLESVAGRMPPGYRYRLPTEAEWEYCCRAGTTTAFHCGAEISGDEANIQASIGGVIEVGCFPANSWGLCDMHGNVAEWCLDAWDGVSGYALGPVVDPFGMDGELRIQRGGAWPFAAYQCASAYREGAAPTSPCGFRVVLAPIL